MVTVGSTARLVVAPVGPTAGVAWVSTQPGGGRELSVIGKLTFRVLGEGHAEIVASEPPGSNLGQPAPEELQAVSGRVLVVRGQRPAPGRVIIRRGAEQVAGLDVAAGSGFGSQRLTGASLQTTTSGRRGEEWLVVEGLSAPGARRWCKVPKLGLLASVGDSAERFLLGVKLTIFDAAQLTLCFLFRGSRKLADGPVRGSVLLRVMDLDELQREATRTLGQTAEVLVSPPPPRVPPLSPVPRQAVGGLPFSVPRLSEEESDTDGGHQTVLSSVDEIERGIRAVLPFDGRVAPSSFAPAAPAPAIAAPTKVTPAQVSHEPLQPAPGPIVFGTPPRPTAGSPVVSPPPAGALPADDTTSQTLVIELEPEAVDSLPFVTSGTSPESFDELGSTLVGEVGTSAQPPFVVKPPTHTRAGGVGGGLGGMGAAPLNSSSQSLAVAPAARSSAPPAPEPPARIPQVTAPPPAAVDLAAPPTPWHVSPAAVVPPAVVAPTAAVVPAAVVASVAVPPAVVPSTVVVPPVVVPPAVVPPAAVPPIAAAPAVAPPAIEPSGAEPSVAMGSAAVLAAPTRAESPESDLARAALAERLRVGAAGNQSRDADLSGADLQGARLAGHDFSGADLRGCNLRDADLSRATLSGARLDGSVLDGAKLQRATLTGASLLKASMVGVSARSLEAASANFQAANLTDADLRSANFAGCFLNGTVLRGIQGQEADFSGADLSGANLDRAGLHRANLGAAKLEGASFAGADLRGADLSGAAAEQAFVGADTRGARR